MFQLSRDTLAEFGCAATKCEALTMRDGSIVNNAVTTVCYLAHGLESLNTHDYCVYITSTILRNKYGSLPI